MSGPSLSFQIHLPPGQLGGILKTIPSKKTLPTPVAMKRPEKALVSQRQTIVSKVIMQ
jgi:hypothetical protein